MTIIELLHVRLVRGEISILSDISWRVEKGQNWALLGANGSGKTTLLKVVTGYEWPTLGEVTVLRQKYGECNLPELRKAVGWVSTAIENRLPERESALGVVASGFFASIGLYQEPTSDQLRRARQALQHVGAGHISNRPFGLLSQGEKQRVLIARSLVNEPPLLLLDEPCAGLDPVARESLLADLEQLAASARVPAVVLVTHHVEEIGPWIGYVLVLKNGSILAAGPKQEVLTGPILSDAFGCCCEVESEAHRYRLRVVGKCPSSSGQRG